MPENRWTAFSIRMPRELHRALKYLSYRTETTMNQLIIGMLVEHLGEYPMNMSEDGVIQAIEDSEIAGLLEIARKQVEAAGFKELDERARDYLSDHPEQEQ